MKYLRQTLLYRLFTAKKLLVQAVKQDFKKGSITDENYITLCFIHENPGISQAALADLNQKDRNVIVRTIDKLEKQNLVRRVRDERDRRAFLLYVTEDGEEIIHQYWGIIIKRQEEALRNLSPEEQETLMTLLDKLITTAGKAPGKNGICHTGSCKISG